MNCVIKIWYICVVCVHTMVWAVQGNLDGQGQGDNPATKRAQGRQPIFIEQEVQQPTDTRRSIVQTQVPTQPIQKLSIDPISYATYPLYQTVQDALEEIKERNVRSITFSPEDQVFVLAGGVMGRTIYILKDATFQELLVAQNVQGIHAITDENIVAWAGKGLIYYNVSSKQKRLFLIKDLGLSEADTIVSVIGKNLNQIILTYRSSNGKTYTRLYKIDNNSIYQTGGKKIAYRSITIGHDDSMWLLDANKNELYQEEAPSQDDEEFLFSGNEGITFTAPIQTIYAHNQDVLYGLDAQGQLYYLDKSKSDFIPLSFEHIPSTGYISLTSPKDGPLYAVHKKIKNQQELFTVYPIPLITQLVTNRFEPLVEEGLTIPVEKESALESPEKSQEETLLTEKPQDAFELGPKEIKRGFGSLQKAAQVLGITFPEQKKGLDIPSGTKQLSLSKQEVEALADERKNPIFEFGFNAGFIAGIISNKAHKEIVNNLRNVYEQGVADGPKACILDQIFMKDATDIVKQESIRALQERWKSALFNVFKGFVQ